MCYVSNVHDHFATQIEPFWKTVTTTQSPTFEWKIPDLDRLESLIKDFKECISAAEKLDVLMKQPDCVDPEKAKLQQRVAELEAKLKEIQKASKV